MVQSNRNNNSPAFGILNKVQAQFNHIGEVKKNLSSISKLMDKLTNLGDVVTEDEIIKTAGIIVGKGWMPANQMAGLLADMPPNGGGVALAKWVLQHDIEVKQQLLQASQLQESVGHQMGISAHHAIRETLTGQEPSEIANQMPGPSNSLAAMPPQGNA